MFALSLLNPCRSHVLIAALALALSGCASLQEGPNIGQAGVEISLVDTNQDGMPEGWRKLTLGKNKQRTLYTPVQKDGLYAVRADTNSSLSGLQFPVRADPSLTPYLAWQWKVENLIETANNTQRSTEDSPVRIVLAFEGDKRTLPFTEQMILKMGKIVSGHEAPYATLVYLWENQQPVGTIIPHGVTQRIKMIVAESGPSQVGQWQSYVRNYAEDFERAFGEKPGRLLSISLVSDSDNTESISRAWYGPLSLSPRPSKKSTSELLQTHTAQSTAIPATQE
jgi:hypothetical protein